MLNFNFERGEERIRLREQREALTDELIFAVEHRSPWGYGGWDAGKTETSTCEKHGNFERFTLAGKDFRGGENFKYSQCPECLREEISQIDARLREIHVADLMDNAGIARRFEDCGFENYQQINPAAGKNLTACQRYAENWPRVLEAGKSLVLTGSSGTGKNHLSVAITKKIIRDHLARVEITDAMRLTRAVKNTWRSGSDKTEDEVLNYFTGLDLLIIDEVGVQFGSPAEMAILHEVINARYESILPTILISNLPPEQLREFISDRIFDRVTDGGRNLLSSNWPSYRGYAA